MEDLDDLFDFDEDLYGRHLRVALIDFIRAEKKFDGLVELKAQISIDCFKSRQILNENWLQYVAFSS